MKEQIIDNWGSKSLRVYPFLAEDADDKWMASAGSIDAVFYYPNNNQSGIWGVKPNITFPMPQSRAHTDSLKAAIDRCWQWIDEQVGAAPGGKGGGG